LQWETLSKLVARRPEAAVDVSAVYPAPDNCDPVYVRALDVIRKCTGAQPR